MSNYQLFHNDLPNKILNSFKGDISIDTETLGLNIKRDRLCLIQLRNETDKKVYLIKFEEDLSPKLSKNINVIDIPVEQRDAVIARILSETHHWEVKDNDDK